MGFSGMGRVRADCAADCGRRLASGRLEVVDLVSLSSWFESIVSKSTRA